MTGMHNIKVCKQNTKKEKQQKGLDSYNRELLDEVINIVHKCLTGQFEEIPNEKVKKKGKRKGRQKDHLSMEYE